MMRFPSRNPLAFNASLRWNLLGWFLLNLAIIFIVLIGFLRVEFGPFFFAEGSPDERLESIAERLGNEVRKVPASRWNEALARAVADRLSAEDAQAAIVDDQGHVLAGSVPPIPPEVRRMLARAVPEPGEPLAGAAHVTSRDQFTLIASRPRLYWAGVRLENIGQLADGPPRVAALVIASKKLHDAGALFDYTPWLLLGLGLIVISAALWFPVIQRLTRGLTDMTYASERIAEGHFEPPRVSARNDELGRLGKAISNMASSLEGHVNGQKRFLGDTAHELLSPLGRLEMRLSILEQQGAAANPAILGQSLSEVRHLAGIVQDLLLYTKSELRAAPVVLSTIPLAPLARAVARREGLGQATVSVEVPEELCALADRDLLDRALSNAVRNAVRYAGKAGPIKIFAASAEHAATEVRLTVLDEGPGAPEETLKKLFDPFFRPDTVRSRETGGTGLGLAIVKSCVEACGGSVTASNRTNAGLAVTFRLNRGYLSAPVE